jgi:hypothetical protein
VNLKHDGAAMQLQRLSVLLRNNTSNGIIQHHLHHSIFGASSDILPSLLNLLRRLRNRDRRWFFNIINAPWRTRPTYTFQSDPRILSYISSTPLQVLRQRLTVLWILLFLCFSMDQVWMAPYHMKKAASTINLSLRRDKFEIMWQRLRRTVIYPTTTCNQFLDTGALFSSSPKSPAFSFRI